MGCKVLLVWLLTPNISFLAAGGTVTALLIYQDYIFAASSVFMLLVIITNIFGATGALSSLAGTILIEREWVVVISNGQPPSILTDMNSTIRRIDLICRLSAHVLSGFIISFISLKAFAVIFALWNMLSVWLQYWLLKSVYNGIPALSESRERRRLINIPADLLDNSVCAEEEKKQPAETSWKHKIMKFCSIDAWIVYAKQELVLPGISLALLYFTILCFGTLMAATLEWKGIPAYIIGIARGISAIVEISTTLLYPVVHSHISILRTGLWSIWTQWCCLLICIGSIWIRNNVTCA